MSIRSIRVRLTAWYTAVVAIVLLAMAFGMYTLVRRVMAVRSDIALFEVSNTILSAAGQQPDRLIETVQRFRAPDRRVLLMTRDGHIIAESEQMQFREFVDRRVFGIQPTDSALLAAVRAVPERPGRGPRGFRGRTSRTSDEQRVPESGGAPESRRGPESRGTPGAAGTPELRGAGERARGPWLRGVVISDGESPVRVLARPLPRSYPRDQVLVMLGSVREQSVFLDMLRNALIIATLIAIVLAAAPGYFLARRSLAPVSAMSKRAEQIGAQNLDERLPVANPHDELGQLSRVLNDLLDRLQRAFEQQRRFMAEAAHELRTPVAVVRAESELALAKNERSSQEYREALGIVESESKRMSRIVDDLLTLSRVAAGEYPLRRMPIELEDIIARTARSLRVKADERDVSIGIQASDMPAMDADADLIQRMLTNLVDNAIRHARAGSEVLIEARRADKVPVIRIANYGLPISADAQPRIFEPFYRGDAARAGGAESGAGLGLPIAQWIARAHAGELRLVQADGNPTIFEVSLPVAE